MERWTELQYELIVHGGTYSLVHFANHYEVEEKCLCQTNNNNVFLFWVSLKLMNYYNVLAIELWWIYPIDTGMSSYELRDIIWIQWEICIDILCFIDRMKFHCSIYSKIIIENWKSEDAVTWQAFEYVEYGIFWSNLEVRSRKLNFCENEIFSCQKRIFIIQSEYRG